MQGIYSIFIVCFSDERQKSDKHPIEIKVCKMQYFSDLQFIIIIIIITLTIVIITMYCDDICVRISVNQIAIR